MKRTILTIVLLAITMSAKTRAEASKISGVRVEATRSTQKNGLLHWKIINDSDVAVFVYDFFLLGPAYRVERDQSKVIFDTTPVAEEPSCPPNRFPPVLLLMVGPGRTIEGDFVDDSIKDLENRPVSIRIAVGPDPYTLTPKARRFLNSKCQHSPYDAIVQWGTILESNTIQIPSTPSTPSGP